MNIPANFLKQRQGLPLEAKIILSQRKIREFYDHFQGDVYVSFSGGKDSTVLLDLVRSVYPRVPGAFVDTGLEYPEIREFVKTVDNIDWLKPKMHFNDVIEKYGYPCISKTVSMAISRYQNTKSPIQKHLRMHGGINPNNGKYQKMGVIPKKWHYLLDCGFKISDQCCNIMKKEPLYKYSKETGKHGFIGTMAEESNIRRIEYLKTGCNAFDLKHPHSTPLGFWTDKDIWEYIKTKNLLYSSIYDTGVTRTGCMFCMFGVHMEKGENRFQLMKKSHPLQYNYCINKLGCGKVLDYIGVKYD